MKNTKEKGKLIATKCDCKSRCSCRSIYTVKFQGAELSDDVLLININIYARLYSRKKLKEDVKTFVSVHCSEYNLEECLAYRKLLWAYNDMDAWLDWLAYIEPAMCGRGKVFEDSEDENRDRTRYINLA